MIGSLLNNMILKNYFHLSYYKGWSTLHVKRRFERGPQVG